MVCGTDTDFAKAVNKKIRKGTLLFYIGTLSKIDRVPNEVVASFLNEVTSTKADYPESPLLILKYANTLRI